MKFPIAKISNFLVEDETPDLCNNIPNSELFELCQDDDYWLKCTKKCEKHYGTLRDYRGKRAISIIDTSMKYKQKGLL